MIDLDNNSNLSEKTAENSNKTFTQDDVNRIVSKRLTEERAKVETDLKKREEELVKREYLFKAKEILHERKLSTDVLKVLNCTDEKVLKANLDILERCFDECFKKKYGVTEHIEGTGHGQSSNSQNSNLEEKSNQSAIRSAMGLGFFKRGD